MSAGRLFVGLALVAIGTVYLLDQAGVVEAADIVGTWWPAVIVAAGLGQWLRRPRHLLGPGLLVLLGLCLLATTTTDVVDASPWEIFWPLVLILLGLWIVLAGRGRGPDRLSSFVIFGSQRTRSRSENLRGGFAVVLFGSSVLDLRDATIRPDGRASIDVLVAFGGTKVIVPEDWRVRMTGLPLFGGWSDRTSRTPLPDDAPELSLYVIALFGGADIVHRR